MVIERDWREVNLVASRDPTESFLEYPFGSERISLNFFPAGATGRVSFEEKLSGSSRRYVLKLRVSTTNDWTFRDTAGFLYSRRRLVDTSPRE